MLNTFSEKKETLLQFFDKALDKVFADEIEKDYSAVEPHLEKALNELGFIGGIGAVLKKAMMDFMEGEGLIPKTEEEAKEETTADETV